MGLRPHNLGTIMTKYYDKENIPDQKHFLNDSSEKLLEGLNHGLAEVVKRAVAISDIEIQVIDGKRNTRQQNEYFRKGVSQASTSPHLYGYAVDLIALVEGRICLEQEVYDDVANCMRFAGQDLYTPIRWGGAWHCDNLCAYGGLIDDLQYHYIDWCLQQHIRPRLDVHHFELSVAE